MEEYQKQFMTSRSEAAEISLPTPSSSADDAGGDCKTSGDSEKSADSEKAAENLIKNVEKLSVVDNAQ